MDTIKDIWFDANRIYMKTDGGVAIAPGRAAAWLASVRN